VAVLWVCVARFLVAGGYKGVFCEKLLEASPMPDKANASWLQGGPAAGQVCVHQQ